MVAAFNVGVRLCTTRILGDPTAALVGVPAGDGPKRLRGNVASTNEACSSSASQHRYSKCTQPQSFDNNTGDKFCVAFHVSPRRTAR